MLWQNIDGVFFDEKQKIELKENKKNSVCI